MFSDNPYNDVIAVCLVILVSYFFGIIARRTNIPSVLLLILLGIGLQFGLEAADITLGRNMFNMLQVLGIVGLIMIVLEASLDLSLTREKRPLIIKSFLIALFGLLGTTFLLTWIIHLFIIDDFFSAIVYAVPLSIMSSSIILPSVVVLPEGKKEFMIYESTFSDILGIMLFYFLLDQAGNENTGAIVKNVSLNILLTVALSLIVSYLLILLVQQIRDKAKLFLLISMLILLYAVGKLFHLSSLIVILVFGLVLNNHERFFRGPLNRWIKHDVLDGITEEFHTVTLETAFVVRTFFFVVFGMTLELESLLDVNTALLSLAIVASIYVIRFVCFKIFGMKDILPELFIAPRGLITVLLFFGIPVMYQQEAFSSGILLYSILLTGIAMTVAMVLKGRSPESVVEMNYRDFEALDKEVERLKGQRES
ncbi:MAG TPA: cation:proton antiporter [Cyclobacteriaceae bacterium]|nr:cation:proton antiporter [Cyclobacteriaceae bacterium]